MRVEQREESVQLSDVERGGVPELGDFEGLLVRCVSVCGERERGMLVFRVRVRISC